MQQGTVGGCPAPGERARLVGGQDDGLALVAGQVRHPVPDGAGRLDVQADRRLTRKMTGGSVISAAAIATFYCMPRE
jgi:hypothetical protein